MSILLALLGVIIGLFIFIFAAALFIKKEYTIREQITIDKNNREVYDYVRLLKNQEYYNKWVMMDPNVKRVYTGIDGRVNAVVAWDSENKNVGKGEQEIKSLSDDYRMDCEVRFEKPFKNVAQIYMELTPIAENTTNLEWGMTGQNKFPFNFMNLFITGMLAKDMQTSLQNLKNVIEK
ncbi:MAG: SRPBCC family protein [Bacteroidota bacterium]